MARVPVPHSLAGSFSPSASGSYSAKPWHGIMVRLNVGGRDSCGTTASSPDPREGRLAVLSDYAQPLLMRFARLPSPPRRSMPRLRQIAHTNEGADGPGPGRHGSTFGADEHAGENALLRADADEHAGENALLRADRARRRPDIG